MIHHLKPLLSLGLLAAMAASAACDRSTESEIAALDNQLAANAADPALTAALEDQIMIDPELAQQSNRNAIRPAPAPDTARYPAAERGGDGRAGAAARSVSADAGGGCVTGLDHGAGWARRLPEPFALYPGGRLTGAAGNERLGCETRIVTYAAESAPGAVLDWYQARLGAAGYSAERLRRDGDLVMGGVDAQGGAYYLIVTPRGRGSDVSLIAATG